MPDEISTHGSNFSTAKKITYIQLQFSVQHPQSDKNFLTTAKSFDNTYQQLIHHSKLFKEKFPQYFNYTRWCFFILAKIKTESYYFFFFVVCMLCRCFLSSYVLVFEKTTKLLRLYNSYERHVIDLDDCFAYSAFLRYRFKFSTESFSLRI